jgi:hypothetical protein
MGLPVGEVVGLLLAGVVLLAVGKKLTSGNSEPVERDETVNNPDNISYGGRSRRNRQRKNQSRRR